MNQLKAKMAKYDASHLSAKQLGRISPSLEIKVSQQKLMIAPASSRLGPQKKDAIRLNVDSTMQQLEKARKQLRSKIMDLRYNQNVLQRVDLENNIPALDLVNSTQTNGSSTPTRLMG